jgi:ATP-dependent helicase/nuclease subunit B
MKLAAFPPETAFLPALAHAWLAAPGDAQAGLLILPNRRAARALAGAFLNANAGRALLLPRIISLASLDETPLALAGALDLPPAVTPMQRQALLAKLILQSAATTTLHAAWALAADLATLLDDADYGEIDLAKALPNLVPEELAAHWQTTLKFLTIITAHFPAILAELGLINPAARQVALINAQNAAWAARPPTAKIWMVARDANPALARLAGTIAGLPQGRVILPGYDPTLPDAAWDALDDSHAQSGIAHLLAALGARRDEILLLPAPTQASTSAVPPGRSALLSRALLPGACLLAWQEPAVLNTAGLTRLEASDEQEDATAIAMALRAALETPGATAALITPDRALASRVTAALARFGIAANDSAGEPLADTPPGILLRLAARAAAAEFAPVPLLALLKHPLTAAGNPPEITRADARALERAALRGPRPPPGLEGIRFRLAEHGKPAGQDFLARLETCLAPLTGLAEHPRPADALRALIAAAEALAATEAQPGAAIIWSGEAGAALSDHLLEATSALEDLPEIAKHDLPALLDAILANTVIRRPRTRDSHPRIAIWGVQEAMLQTVDVAVLGGLHEGVWPAAAEPGPWLSRPMRRAAGLPTPEQAIGRAAHDFFSLSCACPEVILAAPTRRDRAPAVPARWLTRLDATLAGADSLLPRHPAPDWAAQLDRPEKLERRPAPRPRPAAANRPATLSISDIATLIADPYAIYAKKILRIHELAALDEESDASQFGNIVHAGLAAFFTLERDFAAPDAAAALTVKLQTELRKSRPRAALQHWWEARLARIACWVVELEAERRRNNQPAALALELSGELCLPGGFTLKGRVDRIERTADGNIFIADYKTGEPPHIDKVQTGAAPQLPLEAVMAEAGAFGEDFTAPVTELAFWQISGRHKPGAERVIKPELLRTLIETAGASVADLFDKFADPATPYLAKPHPARGTYRDTYSGISRRGEWEGAADDS